MNIPRICFSDHRPTNWWNLYFSKNSDMYVVIHFAFYVVSFFSKLSNLKPRGQFKQVFSKKVSLTTYRKLFLDCKRGRKRTP